MKAIDIRNKLLVQTTYIRIPWLSDVSHNPFILPSSVLMHTTDQIYHVTKVISNEQAYPISEILLLKI